MMRKRGRGNVEFLLDLTSEETIGMGGEKKLHDAQAGFRTHGGKHVRVLKHLRGAPGSFGSDDHISIFAEISIEVKGHCDACDAAVTMPGVEDSGKGAGMKLSWQKSDAKGALLTAVATCVSYWIAVALGLQSGYWAAITSIVVTQSEVGATIVASRDRLIGTAIGALVGWGAVLIWHGHLVVFGLAVGFTILACNSLNLKSAGRLAGVTVAIVVLSHQAGPAWQTAASRFMEVSLGVIVALLTNILFYPRAVLRGKLKLETGG